MPGRPGPRFALEAGFLIVLAVLASVADLSWPLIVLVMGVGWGLASVVEVARWKEGPRLPAPVPRSYVARWAPVDDVTRVIPREHAEPGSPPRELADDLRPAPRPRHVRVIARDDEGKD
jgi:hypothetical protein